MAKHESIASKIFRPMANIFISLPDDRKESRKKERKSTRKVANLGCLQP